MQNNVTPPPAMTVFSYAHPFTRRLQQALRTGLKKMQMTEEEREAKRQQRVKEDVHAVPPYVGHFLRNK